MSDPYMQNVKRRADILRERTAVERCKDLERENRELKRQLARLQKPSFIEKVMRFMKGEPCV